MKNMIPPDLPRKIKGVVTPFAGNGRRLGYPTANVLTPTDLPDGVYFGLAGLGPHLDKPALVFIGTPTTIGDSDRRVEAHVLDIPDEDYYGLELSATLTRYHRPNQTLASLDVLIELMRQDEKAARAWFKNL